MLGAAAVLAGGAVRAACAQATGDPEAAPESAVEAYLEHHGLREVLAEHLGARLADAPAGERRAIAERLGALLVTLLERTTDAGARREWEDRARALLEILPDSGSAELRLSLAKATYVQAEALAERRRLRLSTPEQDREAERILRGVRPTLAAIGAEMHRRAEQLERLELSGRDSEQSGRELTEARRLRSLAFYFAGWSDVYLAEITGSPTQAGEAIKEFGWLLGAGEGRPPAFERFQTDLLRYEHIARAAIGCAVAHAVRGDFGEAGRWLDAVDAERGTPAGVRDQLLARRISILGAGRRWADLERLIRQVRHAPKAGSTELETRPLPTPVARLLAVVCLEAEAPQGRETVALLVQIALADLIARSETAHVLDLVDRYGTAPIGDSGFIAHYVRGYQAFQRARAAHVDAGGGDDATADGGLAEQFRAAATLLRGALAQADASSFPAERAGAAVFAGRSLLLAGDWPEAAALFEQAAAWLGTGPGGEEALWLAATALDRAVTANPRSRELREHLDQVAAVLARTYPGSERAAALLMRRLSAGAAPISAEDTVGVLLGVARDAPSYASARRHAARLLYELYRRAPQADRPFAAARFIGIGEEALALDRREATTGSGPAAEQAVRRVITGARQLLDALLSQPAPDVARADAVLVLLRAVALYHGTDLTPFAGELAYRELQVALGRGDDTEVGRLLTTLAASPGPFRDAGERLVLRSVTEQWRRAPSDLDAAARVAALGLEIVGRAAGDGGEPTSDAALAVYAVTAEAATALWDARRDPAMRDAALRLDRAILAARPNAGASLRRVARLAEDAGEGDAALDAWRRLLAGTDAAAEPGAWFEARFHSLRLLAVADPAGARVAFDQYRALHPGPAPVPWDERFRELERTLPPAPPASTGGA